LLTNALGTIMVPKYTWGKLEPHKGASWKVHVRTNQRKSSFNKKTWNNSMPPNATGTSNIILSPIIPIWWQAQLTYTRP